MWSTFLTRTKHKFWGTQLQFMNSDEPIINFSQLSSFFTPGLLCLPIIPATKTLELPSKQLQGYINNIFTVSIQDWSWYQWLWWGSLLDGAGPLAQPGLFIRCNVCMGRSLIGRVHLLQRPVFPHDVSVRRMPLMGRDFPLVDGRSAARRQTSVLHFTDYLGLESPRPGQ